MEYEKYQELQAKSQKMQEDYERQLQEMDENKERSLEELTEYYETKLQEMTTRLEQVRKLTGAIRIKNVVFTFGDAGEGKTLNTGGIC